MSYINHFNKKSNEYLQFRPTYPDQLYLYLASLVKEHDLAWDCGTGNGQAAIKLADYFHEVVATDIHQAQLDVALKKENIHYYCCSAEKTNLVPSSVDLITVAQALHWFHFDKFYEEVRRVAKPNAIISAWCYSLGKINVNVNPIIEHLYYTILGDEYWPIERKFIDEQYHTIPFPFEKVPTPDFTMHKELNFSQLIGYLTTWSAVKEYQKKNHKNPIDLIYSDLQIAWGNPESKHNMHWPIHLLVGSF